MKKLIRLFVLPFLCASLLSACGWHLRGTIDLPDGLNSIYIQSTLDNELRRELSRSLTANGITVTNSSSDSQFIIALKPEAYGRHAVAVGSSALAEEYELIMEVPYRITDAQGNDVTSEVSAQASRSYTYNRNAAVAMNQEEQLIKREMRSHIVQSILQRLRVILNATPTK